MRFVVKTLIAAVILSCVTQRIAAAEDYPTRPIRVIVPYAAGGPSDTGARLMSEPLGRQLGQAVVIENQGGGGGLNATKILREICAGRLYDPSWRNRPFDHHSVRGKSQLRPGA